MSSNAPLSPGSDRRFQPVLAATFRRVGATEPLTKSQAAFLLSWALYGVVYGDANTFITLQANCSNGITVAFRMIQNATDPDYAKKLNELRATELSDILRRQRRVLTLFAGKLDQADVEIPDRMRALIKSSVTFANGIIDGTQKPLNVEFIGAKKETREPGSTIKPIHVNPVADAHFYAHLLYIIGERLSHIESRSFSSTEKEDIALPLKNILASVVAQIPFCEDSLGVGSTAYYAASKHLENIHSVLKHDYVNGTGISSGMPTEKALLILLKNKTSPYEDSLRDPPETKGGSVAFPQVWNTNSPA